MTTTSDEKVESGSAASVPFHPIADLFPMTEGEAFDALVADMGANGFRDSEKIVLHEGQILDGRNRYHALQVLVAKGMMPGEVLDPQSSEYFIDFDGTGFFSEEEIRLGPLAFVIAKNLHRRHLTESQRGMVAASIATMRQGERTDLKPSAELQKVSQEEAATLANVSARTVASAAKIRKQGTPGLADLVVRGVMRVGLAEKAVSLPTETQQEIVNRVNAGDNSGATDVLKTSLRERKKRKARSARDRKLSNEAITRRSRKEAADREKAEKDSKQREVRVRGLLDRLGTENAALVVEVLLTADWAMQELFKRLVKEAGTPERSTEATTTKTTLH